MTVTVKFNDGVSGELARLKREVPNALKKAILREAHRIFAESQRRVPVYTGRLRASGGVGFHEGKVVIFYGTVYALVVHEIHRDRSKYLEGPFREALPGMAERIAKDARRIAGIPST